jgi:hypothetical protein
VLGHLTFSAKLIVALIALLTSVWVSQTLALTATLYVLPPCHFAGVQGNFTFSAELIVALIAFLTSVWLSLYMGWAIHSLRLIPRFTNTLLACCGRQYEVGTGC